MARFSSSRLRKFPTKDLLATGILDGDSWRIDSEIYQGSKARKNGATGLRGMIRNSEVSAFVHDARGLRLSHPLCLSYMLAVQINVSQSTITWMMGIAEITSVMSWMPTAICRWSQWRKLSKNVILHIKPPSNSHIK